MGRKDSSPRASAAKNAPSTSPRPQTAPARNASVQSPNPSPSSFDWRTRADGFFGRMLVSSRRGAESSPIASPAPSGRPSSSFSLSSFIHQFILISAALFILLVALAILSPFFLPPPSWSVEVSEAPLHKNAQLGLRPGDGLVYALDTPDGRTLIHLQASRANGCPGVLLADADARAAYAAGGQPAQRALPASSSYSVCVGFDGVERAPNGSSMGSNLSFSSLAWPYFQPWMLALADNWSWSANSTLVVQPFNQRYSQPLLLHVAGRQNVSGRDAFIVELSALPSSDPIGWGSAIYGSAGKMAIDSKQRVLLSLSMPNATLTLVQAPFLAANQSE